MKRVPLGTKKALMDILEEDNADEVIEPAAPPVVNISEIGNKKAENVVPKSELGNSKSDVIVPISEIGNQKAEKSDKSDYQKITATLEPKMWWLLEDERRRRKMAKMDYSFSEIIREALTDYFIKQGKEI